MRARIDSLLVLLAGLLVWHVAHVAVGDAGLASPAATAARLWTLAARPAFRADAQATAGAFLLAAALSIAGGVLLGAALGLHRIAGRVVEPVLTSLYALPKVTLYPVVLLLFGLGLQAKVAFGVMHGLVPIALVTMNAVRQVRPIHLRTARALRLSPGQTMRRVILPAILPDMAAGLRIGVPLALLGVLIGEMFASRNGLGSVAMRAMEANDGPTLLAVAVLLSAAALAVNAALHQVPKVLTIPAVECPVWRATKHAYRAPFKPGALPPPHRQIAGSSPPMTADEGTSHDGSDPPALPALIPPAATPAPGARPPAPP